MLLADLINNVHVIYELEFSPGCIIIDKHKMSNLSVVSWKVYQLLAHGRWFSQGTPASSTTKTGRHGKLKYC